MNYDEKEYIIYEEGMIVEEINKLDEYALNKKVDPQNNDATHRSEIEVDCRSVKSELPSQNPSFFSRVPLKILGENTPKERCQNRILQELKNRLKKLGYSL